MDHPYCGFSYGDEVWTTPDCESGASLPVRVCGGNSIGEVICERMDGQPFRWRGSDRRVLDIPPEFLTREKPSVALMLAHKLKSMHHEYIFGHPVLRLDAEFLELLACLSDPDIPF